jgi:hypothetical protein
MVALEGRRRRLFDPTFPGRAQYGQKYAQLMVVRKKISVLTLHLSPEVLSWHVAPFRPRGASIASGLKRTADRVYEDAVSEPPLISARIFQISGRKPGR